MSTMTTASPPSWYPTAEWAEDPEDFYYVPADEREAYAAIALEDADLRQWLEPQTSPTAYPVRDRMPEGLRFTDVRDGLDGHARPTRVGFLHSEGGMAAVRAFQHEHARRTVRRQRHAAEQARRLEAKLTRPCSVCGERTPLPSAHRVGSVFVCHRHVSVLLAAITRVAETEVLPDGRTALDAALTVAGQLGPAPLHRAPQGGDWLPPLPPDRPEAPVQPMPV